MTDINALTGQTAATLVEDALTHQDVRLVGRLWEGLKATNDGTVAHPTVFEDIRSALDFARAIADLDDKRIIAVELGTFGSATSSSNAVWIPVEELIPDSHENRREEPVTTEHRPQSPADAIAELRETLELSWDELAALFGVSRRTVHYWARGARLSSANQARLEHIYGTLIGLTRDEIMAPSPDGPSLFRRLVREVAQGRRPYRPYNAIDVISRAEPSDGIGLGGRVAKERPKKAPDGRL